MKCSDLDEMLLAYVNGELPRTQREFIEEHLSGCADCRVALIGYTEVRQRLSSLKELQQSFPDLPGSIMSKIRAAKYAPLKSPRRISVGSFVPRRLNWKMGLIGVLILVLVVSLSVMLPLLFGQNDEALAAEIVLNSPEVKNALNDDTIASVRVMQNTGNIVTVEVTGINGTHLDVKVDLSSKTVMEVVVGPPQNFSDDEVEKVILIIQSDDTIKALLEQGAIIKSMSNYYLKMEPAKLGEGAGEIIEKKVHVTIALGDKLYLADIELISGQLLSFGDYDAMKTIPEIQP